MHKKKKEHKKRGIGWTILRIFLGAAGLLVLVLVVSVLGIFFCELSSDRRQSGARGGKTGRGECG